jgi:hypothetical protein
VRAEKREEDVNKSIIEAFEGAHIKQPYCGSEASNLLLRGNQDFVASS